MGTTVTSLLVTDNFNFDPSTRPYTNALTTNGQLIIGSTSSPNIKIGNIVAADSSIIVGYSSPNITLRANGFVTWQDVSGAFLSNKSNGYFITATASSTLPAAASEGDTIYYSVDTTQILTLTASGGAIIRLGSNVSAANGTCVSTARGDSIMLVYRASNLCWMAQSSIGTWTLT